MSGKKKTVATDTCWSWINPDGNVQNSTFGASSGAIAEMCRRLSIDATEKYALDEIYKKGFKLATVEKTVSVLMILE